MKLEFNVESIDRLSERYINVREYTVFSLSLLFSLLFSLSLLLILLPSLPN